MKIEYKALVVIFLAVIVLLGVVAIVPDVDIFHREDNSDIPKIKIITTPDGKYAVRNIIRTPLGGLERIEPARKGHYDVMPEWTKSAIRGTNVNKLDPIIKSYVDSKNYYLKNVSIPLLLYFDSENSALTFRGSFSNITQIVDKNKIKLRVNHDNLLNNNQSLLHIERLVSDPSIVRIETVVEPLERLLSNDKNIDVMHLSYSQMSQAEENILRSMNVSIDTIYSDYMQIYTSESRIRDLAELYFVTKIEDSDKIVTDLNYAKKITAVDEVIDYWNKVYGYPIKGKNIKIAILDTGYDENNPYLKNATQRIHYYYCGGGNTCTDTNITDTHPEGHGTHVTGIIVNNHSIYGGVAPDVDIYFYKIRDCNLPDNDCSEYIDDAIYNAVYTYGVNIISMSIKPSNTTNEGKDVYSRAIDNVSGNGTIVFISAGNIGESGITADGGAKSAITVGATSHWGNVADIDSGDRDIVTWYSSRGDTSDGRDKPDIVAPGGDSASYAPNCKGFYYGMVSTRANNTGNDSCSPVSYMIKQKGTSMATPFAAGVAALILNATPENFPDRDERAADMKALLMATAQKVNISQDGNDTGNWSDEMGFGRIDLHNALWTDSQEKKGGFLSSEIYPWSSAEWDIEIPANTILFKVVIAWSDPPTSTLFTANGYTCALLNDIDLNVTGPGVSNVSNSECNPVESVEFYNENGLPAGNYTIQVVGDNSSGRFNSGMQVVGGFYVYYTKKPRLYIKSLSSSESRVPPGDSFTVSMSVLNTGTWTAPGVDATISYDTNAFNLTSGEDNPLLGSIGGFVRRDEIRSYTWTFQTNSSAPRGDRIITVNVSDSNEQYTDSKSISVRLLEHSLSPSISSPLSAMSPSSSFNVTVHVYNDGELNTSNVNATINLPSGLSTSESLTKTISFIEAGKTEDLTWNVTAASTDNVAYFFTVDVKSSAYEMNFTDTAVSCVAVSSSGSRFCMVMSPNWNLISIPMT